MKLSKTAAAFICAFGMGGAAHAQQAVAPPLQVEPDGTMTTVAFPLPFSSLASEEAAKAFAERINTPRPASRPQGAMDIAAIRRGTDQKLAPMLEMGKRLYPYTSVKAKIGEVPVETFTPTSGIAPENSNRIVIQVHGGGFIAGGGGLTGTIESIPLASIGRIKVVSVDYRMAPEYRFPAASEDVEVVYRELLKTYRPENIAIYGCSAGGMLSGQAVTWFQKKGLPRPGAIGIICASTRSFNEGDSAQLWTRMGSTLPIVPPAKPNRTFAGNAYFAGSDPMDPAAIPSASKDALAKFPPTLFLTGTRAPEMSAAAYSHMELIELGVKSELQLFDGLDHGFYSDFRLPESRRAYNLIWKFFNENLGKRPIGK